MKKIPQTKRRETLLTNKDKAILSKQLVTLKDDVPVKNDPNEFLIKGINKDKLYDFLRNMEFNRLLSQAISFYGEPSNKEIKGQASAKTASATGKPALTPLALERFFKPKAPTVSMTVIIVITTSISTRVNPAAT